MRTNRLITLPRPIVVLFYLFLILFLPKNLEAQDAPKPVATWLESYRSFAEFRPVALFQKVLQDRNDLQSTVENASILNLDQGAVAELLQVSPQAVSYTHLDVYKRQQ